MKEKGIEKDIKKWRFNGDCTTLMVATAYGRQHVVRWLLHELQFDVNEKNCYGNTALHKATLNNQIECARLLLDAGSLHLKNRSGNTPLDLARINGHKDMQKLLELHHLYKEKWFKNALKGNIDNMRHIYNIMEENGYEKDIKNWRDNGDCTTLMEATMNERQNVLFTKGCGVRTVLMTATMYDRRNTITWLLHKHKVDVNEQNRFGNTALHIAAMLNRMGCARLLLDLGSRLLENKYGYTPLDYAKNIGNREMQKILLSHFHSDKKNRLVKGRRNVE